MADSTDPALDWRPLAAHLAEILRDRHDNDELAECFSLDDGGEDYVGRICAQAALAFLDRAEEVEVIPTLDEVMDDLGGGSDGTS